MWERFELFWTAFERFALFFGFIGALVALVMVVFMYNTVAGIEFPPTPTPVPTPTPQPTPPIGPIIETLDQGFAKIQDTVLTTEVFIDYTVPITLDIRIHQDKVRLKFVEHNRIVANTIAIKFEGDVGYLVGEGAELEFSKDQDNTLNVRMDVTQPVEFDIPIRVSVPVVVPLSSVDLKAVLDTLQTISTTWSSSAAVAPQTANETP